MSRSAIWSLRRDVGLFGFHQSPLIRVGIHSHREIDMNKNAYIPQIWTLARPAQAQISQSW